MGKATILEHLGEGRYSIRLGLDQTRATARLAQVTADLTDLDERIGSAADRLETAMTAVAAAQNAISDKINEVAGQFFELAAALTAAQGAYDAAQAAVEHEQEVLLAMRVNRDTTLAAFDTLLESLQQQLDAAETEDQRLAIQFEIDTAEHDRDQAEHDFGEAIRVQTDALNAATDARNVAKDALDGKQSEWDSRPQNIDVITKMLTDAEPLQAELTAARMEHGELVLRRAAKAQEHAWLSARKTPDPELEAWCADLSEDLSGEVATIEVPGERKAVPVLIRPGYDGRAEWQAAEQHATQVNAVREAQRLVLASDQALALARLNVEAAESLVADRQRWMDLMLLRVMEFPELVESAEAQLDAALLVLEAAQDAVPPAEAVLESARAGFQAARATLQAARDAAAEPGADPDPRMADGQLQPVASSSPWAAFWNRALLPAWQKWRPMYRLGKITALSGDTCTVLLDAAYSSQQAININKEAVLEAVPIVYMECNGAAFQVDDRVVVEFAYHDQSKPRVIGFESNPRPCGLHGMFAAYGGADVAYSGWQLLSQFKLHPGDDVPTADFTAAASQKLGGPIAVTGPVEREFDGTIKAGEKYDVWSVGTNSHGWCPDRFPRGGALYRNGRAHVFNDVIWDITPGDEIVFDHQNISGVGITLVSPDGASESDPKTRRLMVISICGQPDWHSEQVYISAELQDDPGALSDTPYGFQGDYLFGYSDPPYHVLHITQNLNIGPIDKIAYPAAKFFTFWEFDISRRPMIFYFNESGTRASAVYQGSQDDVLYTGSSSQYLTAVWHLDVQENRKTVVANVELNPDKTAVSDSSAETIVWMATETHTETITSSASTSSQTAAIGYFGDEEKRLIYTTHHESSTLARTGVEEFSSWTGLQSEQRTTATRKFALGAAEVVATESEYNSRTRNGIWNDTLISERDVHRVVILAVDLIHDVIWYQTVWNEYHTLDLSTTHLANGVTCENTRGVVYYSGPGIPYYQSLPVIRRPNYLQTFSWDVGVIAPDELPLANQWLATGHNRDVLVCMPFERNKFVSQLPVDFDRVFYVPSDGSNDIVSVDGYIVTPPSGRLWHTPGAF